MVRKSMFILAATAAAMLASAGAASAASPTVSVLAPTSITTSGATVHATIAPGGVTTFYRVDYGLTSQYTGQTAITKLSSTTSAKTTSVHLGGLAPGTVYHYRFDALNKFGGTVTIDHTFRTGGNPPADAVTGGAVVLADTGAAVNAIINPHGQLTRYHFEFGPAGGTLFFSTTTQTLPAGAAPQAVVQGITGLAPGTLFQYRVVAVHSGTGGSVTTTGALGTFLTFPDAAHKHSPAVASSTTPHRALHRPFVLRTRGHLRSPSGIPGGYGCPQTGRLVVMDGTHRVANDLLTVGADCRFSLTTTIGRLPRARHHPVVVSVHVVFAGNGYVKPSRARAVRVQLGT